jgi:hypothetical protein
MVSLPDYLQETFEIFRLQVPTSKPVKAVIIFKWAKHKKLTTESEMELIPAIKSQL